MYNVLTGTDQHDHDVGVRMVPELPQPPLHILVGEVLGCSSELQHFEFTVSHSPIS